MFTHSELPLAAGMTGATGGEVNGGMGRAGKIPSASEQY